LLNLVLDGEMEAAVMPPQVAFRLMKDQRFEGFARIAQGMGDLTGAPVMSSVLVTHPDVADGSAPALDDVRGLLRESQAYFGANRTEVVQSISAELGLDEEYVRWLAERQDVQFGDLSPDVQEQIVDMWDAALAVGDIEDVPDLESVLIGGSAEANGDLARDGRVTLSMALQDTPMQRLAVFAIERGLVSSEEIDLDITFLPQSDLAQAAAARQYDIIEVSPVAVPTGEARDLRLMILSGGLEDLDSTMLFTASGG
jgi:hypothetical protein